MLDILTSYSFHVSGLLDITFALQAVATTSEAGSTDKVVGAPGAREHSHVVVAVKSKVPLALALNFLFCLLVDPGGVTDRRICLSKRPL
jgi:hypothetical protein